MKYPKLTALLGLQSINIHSAGFWGTEAHARLGIEELEKLENHLANQNAPNEDWQEKFNTLQQQYNELEASQSGVKKAIVQALELNGLSEQITEQSSETDAIVLLGQKCKEYGGAETRHSLPINDGQEPQNETPEKEYSHNKILTDKSKFPTLT